MRRDDNDKAERVAFYVCLVFGFCLSIKFVIPALADVQFRVMQYLFGIGFGFGLGIWFFMAWHPIQSALRTAFQTAKREFWAHVGTQLENANKSKGVLKGVNEIDDTDNSSDGS